VSEKYALVIANTEYSDSRLAKLTAPGKDAEAFAEVLRAPDVSAFDQVDVLLNQPEAASRRAIAKFFANRKPDDLLLLYFSGHGVRDEQGRLFLASIDTEYAMLDATAIPAEFVTRQMDNSRSRRQVLILDCCNSGAFAHGTKAATGASMGMATAFEGVGYGRVVLTATDSTQFAWEGDRIIGEQTANSLFTHYLVTGLEGEADDNGDGIITVDELYDYSFKEIVRQTPKQTPGKWTYKEQGQIVLTTRVRPRTIKPIPLDPELLEDLQSPRNYVREAAVRQLGSILNGNNLGKALSAELALEHVAENDDSRAIARLASQLLEEYRAKKPILPEPKRAITPGDKEPVGMGLEIAPKSAEPKQKDRAGKPAAKNERVDASSSLGKPAQAPYPWFIAPIFILALLLVVLVIFWPAIGGWIDQRLGTASLTQNTPIASDIRIDTLGAGLISTEAIIITNTGAAPVSIKYWWLAINNETVYSFSDVNLSGTIRVNTGSGINTSTAVYLNQSRPLLHSGDIVTLIDDSGAVRTRYQVP
jgi:caspase domain-containing protein